MSETLQTPTAETACEAAFRQIAEQCLTGFDEALIVFLETSDPRGPHKARIALRMLTANLDAFAPILRRKRLGALRGEVKSLFRLLGEVRDSDVYTARREHEKGHAARARENRALRLRTRSALRLARAKDFGARTRHIIGPHGAIFRRNRKALRLRAEPLGEMAREALDAAWGACLRDGASVAEMTVEARHDFRKNMKTLRYLSEFFGALVPGAEQEAFLAHLHRMQDALGVLNDYWVGLTRENSAMPDSLPEAEAAAMVIAESTWAELAKAPPPWLSIAQPTRRA